VSEIKEAEFAEVADLIGPSKGEKEVVIKTLGKKVKIRKVTVGELSQIYKVSKENELEQYIWLVYKGLVSPKMNVEQIRQLNHMLLLEIANEISKFSGLDRKSMKKLENLLGKEQES